MTVAVIMAVAVIAAATLIARIKIEKQIKSGNVISVWFFPRPNSFPRLDSVSSTYNLSLIDYKW